MKHRFVSIAKSAHYAGFTLIEMLVVLAILAAVSVVALRSTRGLTDRAHYDATIKSLEAVRLAIVGENTGSPTALGAGSFLNDVGRLPNFAEPGPLSDLWQQKTLMPSHVAVDGVDSDVSLACGWRGPYLQLPIGTDPTVATDIQDGFNHPLLVGLVDTNWVITSVGADGVMGPGEGFDADVSIILPTEVGNATVAGRVVVTANALGNLVTGEVLNPPWTVRVFAYQPDPVSGELIAVEQTSAIEQANSLDQPQYVFNYSFDSLGAGTRILRAYAFDSAAEPFDRSTSVLESPVRRVDLLRGANTLDLEIGE